ncbi:hypothetical protein FNU76_04330 [Chitinimonas arctica]|uniref:Uncharacterized protein n=1 Tax=Chitinimonas arctica TaxID=2594795 RepID=A0A516SBW9_9NEIS|nr:hypothetical protein [Chitinimonas arctica]QDQ25642.1 hypothetical protein FNU76_04330 [Chitinimonas arctica]
MPFNLDVVIDSPPDEHVDMKAALETLQGASTATRLIAETILEEKVPKHLTHKGKVRTSLKQSFKGSYGHEFCIEIYDENLKKKFSRIGKATFVEMLTYFISESLYLESKALSEKSQKIIDRLKGTAEALIEQLRVSALKDIHTISTNFDRDVKIRFRENRYEQTIIGVFNQTTARVLHTTESIKVETLLVGITRLNIHTGNGRLIVKGESETVAFGFTIQYKQVRLTAKKIFSENLDHNNGLEEEQWKYLRITTTPLLLKDGKIIKYIIRSVAHAE